MTHSSVSARPRSQRPLSEAAQLLIVKIVALDRRRSALAVLDDIATQLLRGEPRPRPRAAMARLRKTVTRDPARRIALDK